MMAPNGKKHCCQTLPLDVLSDLPKNVLDDILVGLPLREAVRTSVLSTKWRYNWCRLPELKLDDAVWMKKDLTYDTSNPTKTIYHILTHHVGAIKKFDLSFPLSEQRPDTDNNDNNNNNNRPDIECADIDNLMYFLSKHDIEHLVLYLPEMDVYELPSSFFKFLQLRDLTLRNCKLLPPPTFKGFERLTSLELCEVRISARVLGSLIANSPLLENLVLDVYVCAVLEINAPMLRTFDFTGNLRFLCLKNVPLLSELSLSGSEYEGLELEVGCDIVKLFQSLSALERLQVWNFPAGSDLVPTKLPSILNLVKHYSVCVNPSRLKEVLSALCLIRSFPYLQTMEIEIGGEEKEVPALECLEVECFSDVKFNHLAEVKIINILGADPDFQFIKLLLAKSPVLETMTLQLSLGDEPEPPRTIKILAKVSKFPRASSTAEVAFLGHREDLGAFPLTFER